jgi:hypothetical protein
VYDEASGSSGTCFLHRSPHLQVPVYAQVTSLAMKVVSREDGVTPTGSYSTWQVPPDAELQHLGALLSSEQAITEARCTAACDNNPDCVGVRFVFDQKPWQCITHPDYPDVKIPVRINPSGDVEWSALATDWALAQRAACGAVNPPPFSGRVMPRGLPFALIYGYDGYNHPIMSALLDKDDTHLPTGTCQLLGGFNVPRARTFVRVMGNSIQQRLVWNSASGRCPPGYWSSTGTADCTPCPEGRTTRHVAAGRLDGDFININRYRDQLMDCVVKPGWGVMEGDNSTPDRLAEVEQCPHNTYSAGADIVDPDNPNPDVSCTPCPNGGITSRYGTDTASGCMPLPPPTPSDPPSGQFYLTHPDGRRVRWDTTNNWARLNTGVEVPIMVTRPANLYGAAQGHVAIQIAYNGRALRHAAHWGWWEPFVPSDGDGVWMLTALPDGSYIIDTPWGNYIEALTYNTASDRLYNAERANVANIVKWRLVPVQAPLTSE